MKELAPHIAIIAEFPCVSTNAFLCGASDTNGQGQVLGGQGVSLKGLAFHCERRGLLRSEGVSDLTAIGVVGLATR